MSGKKACKDSGREAARWKSRRGFGLQAGSSRARSSNTSVSELMSDERYTKSVLKFVRVIRVGMIKAGVTHQA